jgi:pilus assembly protein CpaF
MVDARLPDGSRVNAVIPPVAVDGPLLSIRRFGRHAMKGEDLVAKLALTEGMLELLKGCVEARLNILICAGTGSGKTTQLTAVSCYIPEDERIVTIEDAAELRLQQTHGARMETRPPNIEGSGAVTIRQLVINSFRMRPDRNHRGRGSCGRSFGHAAGDEHRPLRVAYDAAHQHATRRAGPP